LLPNRKELTLLLLAIPLRVVQKAEYMHYYQFHIGDYKSHTHHLSLMEDLAYRRLLDFYFLHEQPIKHRDIARQIGMREHEEDVMTVLNEFFISTEDGFVSPRADKEIKQYKEFAEAGKRGAAKRWGTPPNGEAISPPNATPIATNNHKPLTINHKPIKENKRGSRLPQDWFLTKAMGDWATHERPDLDVRQVAEQFKDYWAAQAGQKGVKLDWDATWRNWVRNTKSVKPNPYDVGRLTVPSKNEPDPALLKIEEDAKKAAPIPLEVLAKMAELRRKA
jgi:uncharacterized protein YdaU (DUF1376 family)